MKTKLLLRNISFSITVVSLLLLPSCHTGNETRLVLEQAADLMQQHPDSSLQLLKTISPKQLGSQQTRAYYSLLYSQALDKNYIDLTSDSIISVAVKYYSRKKDLHKKALAYYYQGRIYYNAKETELAIKALVNAETAVRETGDPFLSGQICNTLGNLYYAQNLYNDAIQSYETAGKHFLRADRKDSYANMLSYIAKAYYLQNKDSLSIRYHSEAIDIYEQTKNSKKALSNTASLADILIKNHRIDSTIALLNSAYQKYCHGIIPLRDYPLWSKIYLEKKNFSQARYYATEYLNSVPEINSRIKSGIILILKDIEATNSNYKKAYEYNETYLILAQAIEQEEKDNFVKEIEEKYKKEQLEHSYRLLQVKHTYQMIVAGLIITVLLALSYIIARKLTERRKEMEEEKNKEISTYKQLNKTLQSHYKELEKKYQAFKIQGNNSKESEDFLNAYEVRLQGLRDLLDTAYITDSHPEKFYKKFKEYINSFSKDKSSFLDLHYLANQKYYGIIDYLKEQYPHLNESDLNYCSMICLGFSSNSIRLIYGHTSSVSIYNRRSKLHGKLGIEKMQIETFIRQLMDELALKNEAPATTEE